MEKITAKTPWAASVGDVPMKLAYFPGTMFEAVEKIAQQHPQSAALDFMGSTVTYGKMLQKIEACAKALVAIGIQPGDKVTIALPNCPQAVYLFYAVNLAGGIANMIHPLSAQKEIEFYLTVSESVAVITLDQFYGKFSRAAQNVQLRHLIITSVSDVLSPVAKLVYHLSQGRKIERIPDNAYILYWDEFLEKGEDFFGNYKAKRIGEDPAVILYSGGTTGTTKGVVLTNRNLNALGQQVVAANPMFCPGDKMLAAMPIFHGFGLGICIHTMLMHCGRCVLVPRFTPKSFARDLVKHRCSFVAGVPTMFEALLQLPNMETADLSSLKGVFCGGDMLTAERKHRIDRFLQAHKATVSVREGYGTTETVTACCLTPRHIYKKGSFGLPFPDTYIKIVQPGTQTELPYMQEGEILVAGPTVMQGYLNCPEETSAMLQPHRDGLTWVRTGDLGIMDEQGFVYFRGRVKRMIVTSGYNVYPAQLENILDAHEKVQMSCIIGIPDSYRMQKVKAFVKLSPGAEPSEETKQELMAYCREHIAKYAMPCDMEFREDFPKTPVGKIAYRVLEEESQNA